MPTSIKLEAEISMHKPQWGPSGVIPLKFKDNREFNS